MKKSTILALAAIVASAYGITLQQAEADVQAAGSIAIHDIQEG